MRKITALILAALMILSLAACETAPKQTTYEKYREAYENTNALSEQDAHMDMNMDIAMQGMTVNMPMTCDMQLHRDGDTISEMALAVAMTVMGSEQKYNAYYRDGYIFYDMDAMKYKQAITIEELTEQQNTANVLLLNEEMMVDATERTENDATIIELTVDGAAIKDQLMALIGDDLSGMVGIGDISPEDITISDVTASFTINAQAYFTHTSIQFHLELATPIDETSAEPANVSCDMDLQVEYRNPGQPVTITPPADIDSFQDLTLVMENGGQMTADQEAAITELLDLYSSDEPVPLENYDEGFAALTEKYGADTMAYADQYVQYLVAQFNAENAAASAAETVADPNSTESAASVG